MTAYYQIFEGCYTHTSGLDLETAYETLGQLTITFPHKEFYMSPDYDYEERLKEEGRVYNNNAVDGWEDLFNY